MFAVRIGDRFKILRVEIIFGRVARIRIIFRNGVDDVHHVLIFFIERDQAVLLFRAVDFGILHRVDVIFRITLRVRKEQIPVHDLRSIPARRIIDRQILYGPIFIGHV